MSWPRCRRAGSLAWWVAAAVALAGSPALPLEVPFLAGRVNDLADLIPTEHEARIEASLAELEQATGAQVAVLTIPSLEGEVLEEFSLRVAETWQLGRAEEDDGVLLLVARDDRKMRIEVGYGLEGRLTDLESGRILNGILRPRFRAGDFGGGIETGVAAIAAAVRGEAVDIPDPPAAGGDMSDAPLWFLAIFLGIFALVIGPFSIAALFSPGCHGWFLWLFLTPFWTMFPMVLHPIVGAVLGATWFLGYPLVKLWLGRSDSGKRFLAEHPKLVTFATSRGGSSGGGWSSGGFSGGGGSFGGGGASSSW